MVAWKPGDNPFFPAFTKGIPRFVGFGKEGQGEIFRTYVFPNMDSLVNERISILHLVSKKAHSI